VLAAVDNIADIRRSLTGGAKRSFGGILDVIAWRKTEILMVECKRLHKDRLRRTQEEWMHCALLAGIGNLQLGVFEWQIDDSTQAFAVPN
jgi:hypothetical protein